MEKVFQPNILYWQQNAVLRCLFGTIYLDELIADVSGVDERRRNHNSIPQTMQNWGKQHPSLNDHFGMILARILSMILAGNLYDPREDPLKKNKHTHFCPQYFTWLSENKAKNRRSEIPKKKSLFQRTVAKPFFFLIDGSQ